MNKEESISPVAIHIHQAEPPLANITWRIFLKLGLPWWILKTTQTATGF